MHVRKCIAQAVPDCSWQNVNWFQKEQVILLMIVTSGADLVSGLVLFSSSDCKVRWFALEHPREAQDGLVWVLYICQRMVQCEGLRYPSGTWKWHHCLLQEGSRIFFVGAQDHSPFCKGRLRSVVPRADCDSLWRGTGGGVLSSVQSWLGPMKTSSAMRGLDCTRESWILDEQGMSGHLQRMCTFSVLRHHNSYLFALVSCCQKR